MIWYKYENTNGHFYSPFISNKSTLKSYDSALDLVTDLNKINEYTEVITNNIALVYEKNAPNGEPQNLPLDVYSYESSNNSSPERLVPFSIRDDNYINLLDSLNSLNDSIDEFIGSKKLYEQTRTIHKLGVLLFGPPGTGKTSYLREFIRKRKDAIVIFLDGVPSRRFVEKLEESTKDTLKIFVFEEAVSLLEDSDDIRYMLDFLDGSKSVSNSIYFLSTNYPESIPENVVRNGRVDLFVEVGYPSEEARQKLIKYYLDRESTQSEIKITENMPIVDIREICFTHKKTSKSFEECAKLIEQKHRLLKKHFGKSREIRLT